MGNHENLQQTNFEAAYQGDILQSLTIKIVDDSGIYINGSYSLGRHSSKTKNERTTILEVGGMLSPRSYIDDAKHFDVEICSALNKGVAKNIAVGCHASFSIYNGDARFSATAGQSKTPSFIGGGGSSMLYSTRTETNNLSFLVEEGITYTVYLGNLEYSLEIKNQEGGKLLEMKYEGEVDLSYANQEA